MNAVRDRLRAKFVMKPTQRGLFVWLMAGLICATIGLSTSFVPSRLANLVLMLTSLTIGVLIVAWSHRHPVSRQKIRELPLPKHAGFFVLATFMFAAISAGNLYMVMYAAHALTAEQGQTMATVSYKGTELDLPGRCTRYVRFRDFPYPYFRKLCVSDEAFEDVQPGSRVAVLGSQSSIGFRLEAIRARQDNGTAEPDVKTSSASSSQ